MLRTGVLLATFIVTTISIGLIGRILSESNAKAGILTLGVRLYLPLLKPLANSIKTTV